MVQNILKRDSLVIGLILGFIAPLFSVAGYYLIRFRIYSFGEYLYALVHNKPLLTGITIPCLLLNIVLLTIYLNKKKDQTAKGIFAISLIYALASLFLKFLG